MFSHAQHNDWNKLSQPIIYSPLGSSPLLEGPIDSIVEDPRGLMWLSSANGLWRWDSHFLTKVQFSLTNENTLHPQIQHTFKDKQNRIWVGTNLGLYHLDYMQNKLVPVASQKISGLSIQNITSARVNNEDILILAGDRQLFQFHADSDSLTPLQLPVSTRIYAIHIDNSNTLWVGTDKGLFIASPNQGQFDPLRAVETFPKDVRISVINTISNGTLVIGTAQHGLYVSQAEGGYEAITLVGDAHSAWIYNMIEQQENVLLLGTFGYGLVEVDLTTNTQRHFPFSRLHPSGLSDSNIWCLYKDSRGLVWIGAGNTLNVFDARNTAIKHLLGGMNLPNGLTEPKVHAVVNLPNSDTNSLIIANGNQGLVKLSADLGVTQRWLLSVGDPIETLFTGATGTIYASSNFATVALSPSEREISPVSLPNRPATAFTGAFADSGHNLWLGGPDGLWKQSKSSPETGVQILDDTIHDRRVSALLATSNTLWIGTWRGLYSLPLTEDSHGPTITASSHPALQQQFISDIYADSLGQVWVATSSGGLFVQSSQSEWFQITDANGLPGNSIAAIAGESAEKIWIGSSRGIASISIHNKQVQKVVTGRQAINSPYSRGAATTTSQGDVVFGGTNGLTLIAPSHMDESNGSLTLLFINANVLTQQDELKPLQTGQSIIEMASLPKRVMFEFAALDYLAPEQIQYRYRVVGLDDSWTLLDADHRSVTLTSLAPGNYQIDIEYAFNGEQWETNTLSQQFTVLPAWYQTTTARIATILLIIGAIYVLHKLGLRHYQYRQHMLEQKVEKRTAELITANQKLTEQAAALEKASLTDSLTGLNNRRFLSQHIKRDLLNVHQYYADCEQKGIRPTNDADLLILVIDLDHFKRINDTHGHHIGDAVLVETRQRLSRIFRDTDYLIRWGGEEFLAVVHNYSRSDAHILAERVVTEINDTEFCVNDQIKLKVSCSVGFAPYPLQQQHYNFFNWHTTVAIADAALYQSKNRSRDTWTGVVAIKEHASEETLALIEQQPSRVFDHALTLVRP